MKTRPTIINHPTVSQQSTFSHQTVKPESTRHTWNSSSSGSRSQSKKVIAVTVDRFLLNVSADCFGGKGYKPLSSTTQQSTKGQVHSQTKKSQTQVKPHCTWYSSSNGSKCSASSCGCDSRWVTTEEWWDTVDKSDSTRLCGGQTSSRGGPVCYWGLRCRP